MTLPKELTRKAGPLPVIGWAALALLAFLLWRHGFGGGGGTSGQTPVRPNVGSAAQSPSSGQGSPADNANGDLLDALGRNKAAADRLLAAVQAASGGGLGTTGGGPGSTGASSMTAAVTAPTVTDSSAQTGDTGVTNDGTTISSGGDPSTISSTGGPATISSGTPVDPGFVITDPQAVPVAGDGTMPSWITGHTKVGDPANGGNYTKTIQAPDVPVGYGIGDVKPVLLPDETGLSPAAAVAAPTPTPVQPSPVAWHGVLAVPEG